MSLKINLVWRFFILLIGLLLLSGCAVPDKCWHCCENVKTDKKQECVATNKIETVRSITLDRFGRGFNGSPTKDNHIHADFHRTVLEYRQCDNQGNKCGESWDSTKIGELTNYLKSQGKKNPIYLVLYVHGWHHNASPEDGNFKKFDDILARVKDQLIRRNKSNTKVVGVYIGWQGESIDTPLATILTIGSRTKAAEVIAFGGKYNHCVVSCNEIAEAYKSPLYKDLKELSKTINEIGESRMLIFGHSLGGRLLTRLFQRDLECGNSEPLGHMATIVTINPAVGADAFDNIMSVQNNLGKSSTLSWINITSRDDNATDSIFSTAVSFGLVPVDSKVNPSHKKTIGHYKPYITHTLDVQSLSSDGNSSSPVLCPLIDNKHQGFGDIGIQCKINKVLKSKILDEFSNIYDINITLPFKATPFDNTEPKWYLANNPITYSLMYREREDKKYKEGCCGVESQIEIANLKPINDRAAPLNGALWNIQTTKNVIDTDEDISFSAHNAYIQTNLIKMIIELSESK